MTQQTKHTPGPWFTFDDGSRIIGVAHYIEESPYNDGRDTTIIFCDEQERTPSAEMEFEANARLIAAAPELLVALKFIKERIEKMPVTGDIVHMVCKIDGAIAKAEGRS